MYLSVSVNGRLQARIVKNDLSGLFKLELSGEGDSALGVIFESESEAYEFADKHMFDVEVA